jgi:DNA-binding beta-propeller fold protein YncE
MGSIATILWGLYFIPMPVLAFGLPQPVTTGVISRSIAVNTVTNTMYVANFQQFSILAIDDETQKVKQTITWTDTNSTLAVNSPPTYLAVNSDTNKIYFSYACTCKPNIISVIDGSTGKFVDKIEVPFRPSAIATNSETNKVYIAYDKNLTTVIDGSTDKPIANITTTEPVSRIALNSVTNVIYLATTTPAHTIYFGDGSTNRITGNISLPLDSGQYGGNPLGANIMDIAVNQKTNTIYAVATWVFPQTSDTVGLPMPKGFVTLINGSSNEINNDNTTVNTPIGIAIDPTHNRTFIAEYFYRDLLVLDQLANSTKTSKIPLGEYRNPTAIAFNMNTGNLYAATTGSSSLVLFRASELQTPEFPVLSSIIIAGFSLAIIVGLRRWLGSGQRWRPQK